ncbi:hypothetical protein H4R24_000814 [Coemansia sp. RSA 988]|nr:hypothetical protein H4R24_000814 [Coemansia sp. RSA 988]
MVLPFSAPDSRSPGSSSPEETTDHSGRSGVSSPDFLERKVGNSISGVGSSETSHSGQYNARVSFAAAAAVRHPRYMLPRASGMSTMGEIHSLAPPHVSPPTEMASSPPGYDQSSVYPATWHEYEDQFNYFYNCHFIEQDYYNYLSGNLRRPGDNDSDSSSGQSIASVDESEYGESSYPTTEDEDRASECSVTSAALPVGSREESTTQ